MLSFCLIQSCWTCTWHVPKRRTLINIINKCCILIVSFRMDFGIAETGDCTWQPSRDYHRGAGSRVSVRGKPVRFSWYQSQA
jgi:hypothetical protein